MSATAVVQVRRRLAAPREEVFRAWIDPDLFAKWFRPSGTFTASVELDVRVGGRWRVAMRAAGRRLYAFGEYVEVDAPSRLVFTWGWDGVPLVRLTDSVVTVELTDMGGETELVLTHERLRRGAIRAWHSRGWRDTLGKLEREVAAR